MLHTTSHMHQKWPLAQDIMSGACANSEDADQLLCTHMV